MKMPFKFAVNRIEDKHLVVSADNESPARIVVSCDEISAFLFSQLTADVTQNEMLESAKVQFPETEEDLLLEKVLKVRELVRNIDPENGELEVMEI